MEKSIFSKLYTTTVVKENYMQIVEFDYMYKDKCIAHVKVNYTENKVNFENYWDNIYFLPFGNREQVTIKDFEDFLETRCFPKTRANCKELLSDLGLVNYSPLLIVLKTHGRQLEDYCWLKFKGEELDYERDIKLRD